MKDFSIDLAAETINDPKSRNYFQEVLSSFINGNYRSSIVMLWSVVVCDLVYKLQSLRDLYNDPAATSLLQEIENKQIANPNSPEWEPFLLDEVSKRTQLLETADCQHLLNLHKLRHLSAHPVLSAHYELFSPNKETTRAALRNALEATLLKPPIFSKRIISEFVTDISAKKDLLPEKEALKKYLDAKYFRNLHSTVEREIQKALWKFCFVLVNVDTNTNRDINTRALKIIYQRDPGGFRKHILDNSAHYSAISSVDEPITALIKFLGDCPALYSALDNAAKVLLTNYAKKDANLFAAAPFISETLLDHLKELKSFATSDLRTIDVETWSALVSLCRDAGLTQHIHEIGIEVYVQSGNFASADISFTTFIDNYLEELDKDRVTQLLFGIESNTQTYWRSRARSDHPKIAARANTIGGIPLLGFSNFNGSIA